MSSGDSIVDLRSGYAVYWAKNSQDRIGKVIVSAAKEIRVQVEKGASQTIDEKGKAIKFDYMLNVPEELVLGSIMWIGKEVDLPAQPGTGNWDIPNLIEVIDYEESTDNLGLLFDRWVKCRKYGGTLPTIS